MTLTRSRNLLAPGVFAIVTACGEQSLSTPPVNLPEPESAAALLLKERCGQCHGVPSPTVHAAQDWLPVLHRMQKRMMQKGHRVLSADELNLLDAYLQRHARGAS